MSTLVFMARRVGDVDELVFEHGWEPVTVESLTSEVAAHLTMGDWPYDAIRQTVADTMDAMKRAGLRAKSETNPDVIATELRAIQEGAEALGSLRGLLEPA